MTFVCFFIPPPPRDNARIRACSDKRTLTHTHTHSLSLYLASILTSEKAHANFVEQARRLDLPALFEKDAKLFDVVFRAVIFYAPTIESSVPAA